MISIRNLHKQFGQKQVLRGVDLEIAHARTTVILGLSGSGKSTIIKHIVRLLEPDSGSIEIDGIDVMKADHDTLYALRKRIGFLFQSGALFDSMNVLENVMFPLHEHARLSKEQMRQKVCEKLDMVGLKPDEVLHLYPHELSGGMRKRVGLARTIVLDPQVILYDEPTSGLDPITSDLITRMILHLQEELKTTSILISHDITESFKAGDHFAMLYEGRIVDSGDRAYFEQSQNPIVRQFLEGRSVGPIQLSMRE